MRSPLLCVLLILAVFADALAQQPQPSTAQTDKIAAKIIKIGIRADVTVKLNNGKTYHGFINRIDDQQFEMSEVDLKSNLVIRYDEVKRVERGYGEKGPLGNRVGKKGRRIGLIVGLAAIVIPLAIVAGSIEE
jgi:small nuclear ribonucleoprotein (snRNP)-like protein